MKIPFAELEFPKAMNLDILIRNMSEKKVKLLFDEYSLADRQDRKITLPSLKCLKKVLCHFCWNKIENGDATWDQIKKELRREFKTLKSVAMTKKHVQKQWAQREKEVKREREKL